MDKRLEIFSRTVKAATDVKREDGKLIIKNGAHVFTATYDKYGVLTGLSSGREGLKQTDVKANYPELSGDIFELMQSRAEELEHGKASKTNALSKAAKTITGKTSHPTIFMSKDRDDDR